MNIWRLMSHHKYPAEFAEWSKVNGTIAIGWGSLGDSRNLPIGSEADLKRLTISCHPQSSISNCVNGGSSLWRLYKEMRNGDVVIISASSSRPLTMRVAGDYYFVNDDASNSYEHRRKADVVPIDADQLWRFSGGKAQGENIRRTLICCAHPLTEAEFQTFAD